MNRIDGKIALITGGTQGLGAAIARLFVQAGAAGIALVGRDQAKGRAIAQSIRAESGVPVVMIAADLGEIAAVQRVVQRYARVLNLTTRDLQQALEILPPDSAGSARQSA